MRNKISKSLLVALVTVLAACSADTEVFGPEVDNGAAPAVIRLREEPRPLPGRNSEPPQVNENGPDLDDVSTPDTKQTGRFTRYAMAAS